MCPRGLGVREGVLWHLRKAGPRRRTLNRQGEASKRLSPRQTGSIGIDHIRPQGTTNTYLRGVGRVVEKEMMAAARPLRAELDGGIEAVDYYLSNQKHEGASIGSAECFRLASPLYSMRRLTSFESGPQVTSIGPRTTIDLSQPRLVVRVS